MDGYKQKVEQWVNKRNEVEKKVQLMDMMEDKGERKKGFWQDGKKSESDNNKLPNECTHLLIC